jgi:hypothetical protein
MSIYIDFIGEGRGSRALAETLAATEKKVEALRLELNGLRSSSERVFQAPPIEWIEERVAGLKEVLERRTEVSALILRRLLGEIRLEPRTAGPETGKAYYLARTSLDALALVEPLPGSAEGGSNSLQWWRRGKSNPRPEVIPRWCLGVYCRVGSWRSSAPRAWWCSPPLCGRNSSQIITPGSSGRIPDA